jgi:drug/metabolite transporter (DMT)-like permease
MSRRGWLLFIAMGVIWGTPYLLIKVAVGEVSPAVVVFVRTVIGAAVLLPLALRGRQLGALRGRWRWLLAFAAAEIIGPWLLLSDAERTLASSTTGLLIATVPIIGVLIARLTSDPQPVTATRWTGLLLGFGGVALLAAPTLESGGWWPVTEVLLTAVGYAGAPFIADRALRDVPGFAVTATSLAVASLVLAPAAVWTWPATLPSGRALLALAGLALVCTALAFVLFVELIREVGAARATVITYVNPAVAVALGVMVLSEPFTPIVGVAFVLILVGSVLATRVRRADQPEAPVAAPAGTAPSP